MNQFISKFNLYEYFRILLPGAYLTFLGYYLLKNTALYDFAIYDLPIQILLITMSSLILGSFIYSLDSPRIFKNKIEYLPTNMMSEEFPSTYPNLTKYKRAIEHEYYQWYEKSEKKSKSKTELLSGLYHFNLNFSVCSLIGLLIGSFLFKHDKGLIFYFNLGLLLFSLLTALAIVKRRLRYQWLRNYWEFRFEFIKSKPEKDSCYKDINLP